MATRTVPFSLALPTFGHPESSGTLAGVAGALRGHTGKAADAGRVTGHSHSAL